MAALRIVPCLPSGEEGESAREDGRFGAPSLAIDKVRPLFMGSEEQKKRMEAPLCYSASLNIMDVLFFCFLAGKGGARGGRGLGAPLSP